MSGLAAGIRLAHYQKRVCILERHTTIGGLNSFYRQGGRNFDVGLHALTNYAPKGDRRGPLGKLLRQLRFTWDEFALVPQIGSSIRFPGVRLDFDNDFRRLAGEIAGQFPRREGLSRPPGGRADGLRAASAAAPARPPPGEVVGRLIRDPLLVEMLFCPLLYYGGPRERDMDFDILRALPLDLPGRAGPAAGRRAADPEEAGPQVQGPRRASCGCGRACSGSWSGKAAAEKVVLDDGTELAARHVLSSAGWPETMRLCDEPQPVEATPGRL